MPTALPYVHSYGKIKPLFEKISSAKVPDAFTQTYLSETLGLASSSDRPLIPLLRALNLIDNAGRPSPEYPLLKNSNKAPEVVARAVKAAYAPLFAANEKAHRLNPEELKGLVAQVAGTDDEITKRTAATFRTLVDLASQKVLDGGFEVAEEPPEKLKEPQEDAVTVKEQTTDRSRPFRPEFHYNIQIHVPSNASEETYLNIFNALRKAFS